MSVCVSVSSSDELLAASSVSVSPPLLAQRNGLPLQSATATLAQAEKMKEIDKYCENIQVQHNSVIVTTLEPGQNTCSHNVQKLS